MLSSIYCCFIATQIQVGYAWIEYKVRDKFGTEDDASDEMKDSVIPVVIGPDNFFYLVDKHHTLAALDYSGFEDVSVYLDVICDQRKSSDDMTLFWQNMAAQNLVYLGALTDGAPNELPQLHSYKDLPDIFEFKKHNRVFGDDPWRSIAGFSRKVTDAAPPAPVCSATHNTTNTSTATEISANNTTSGSNEYCQRCMYRGCVDGYQTTGSGVSYFEFRWAYYMVDATYHDTSLWPSSSQLTQFKSIYEQLTYQQPGSDVDVNAWFEAANLVISLCRSSSGVSYQPPTTLYPDVGVNLPGYTYGYVPLEDDPSCDVPICKF